MPDMELDQFKIAINLTEYAASLGYLLDRRESSRNSVSMRHPDGDKIIIARSNDHHWIYFSVRDDRDNGTIVDFVQKRQRCSLGQVRKTLRLWQGGSLPRPAPAAFVRTLHPSTKDRQKVLQAYARMETPSVHPYLESRAVGKEILGDVRFEGRIKIDQYGNAVFPHYDREGLCGYEIKNAGFTGFSPGGEKGLWTSHAFPEDARMVIAESAIDALSFHRLQGDDATRYVSTAGGWSPNTPSLLLHAAETLPGDQIVLAFDNDAQGKEYEERALSLFRDLGKKVHSSFPTAPGSDWNDVLKAVAFSSFPKSK